MAQGRGGAESDLRAGPPPALVSLWSQGTARMRMRSPLSGVVRRSRQVYRREACEGGKGSSGDDTGLKKYERLSVKEE